MLKKDKLSEVNRIKKKDLIQFKIWNSNENFDLGIVVKIQEDIEFYKVYHILSSNGLELIPQTIIEYELV